MQEGYIGLFNVDSLSANYLIDICGGSSLRMTLRMESSNTCKGGSMEQERCLIIEGSKKKAILVTLIGIGFVTAGIVLMRDHAVIGWLSVSFFGLAIPAGLLQLLRRTYLKLNDDGLEVQTAWKAWRLKWTDVDRFYIWKTQGNSMVAIDFSDAYQEMKIGRQFAEAMSGVQGAIADQYVLSPEEVCSHLNEWKCAHMKASSV